MALTEIAVGRTGALGAALLHPAVNSLVAGKAVEAFRLLLATATHHNESPTRSACSVCPVLSSGAHCKGAPASVQLDRAHGTESPEAPWPRFHTFPLCKRAPFCRVRIISSQLLHELQIQTALKLELLP